METLRPNSRVTRSFAARDLSVTTSNPGQAPGFRLLFSDIFTSFFSYFYSSFLYEFAWNDVHHIPHSVCSRENFCDEDIIPKESIDRVAISFDESEFNHHFCLISTDEYWCIGFAVLCHRRNVCIHDILESFWSFPSFISDKKFHASIFFLNGEKIIFCFDFTESLAIHDMDIIDKSSSRRKNSCDFYSCLSEEFWKGISDISEESF